MILPFPKLEIIEMRLESNALIFSEDIIVGIQLITFLLLLLFNDGELIIVTKTYLFHNHHYQ